MLSTAVCSRADPKGATAHRRTLRRTRLHISRLLAPPPQQARQMPPSVPPSTALTAPAANGAALPQIRGRRPLSSKGAWSAAAARVRSGSAAQICSAAAMGSERLMISKGACPSTAATVRGQESVIQKCENALGVPLAWMKRVYDARGNTPCVTYALTATAPCKGFDRVLTRPVRAA